jgi:hypothetical protein
LRINFPRQAVAYILPGGVPGSHQIRDRSGS